MVAMVSGLLVWGLVGWRWVGRCLVLVWWVVLVPAGLVVLVGRSLVRGVVLARVVRSMTLV